MHDGVLVIGMVSPHWGQAIALVVFNIKKELYTILSPHGCLFE